MGYARYIGRIGALAVALGIGTAVAQPAWAETPNTDSETTSNPTNDEASPDPDKGAEAPAGPSGAEEDTNGLGLDNDEPDLDLDEGEDEGADELNEDLIEPPSPEIEEPIATPRAVTIPEPTTPSIPPAEPALDGSIEQDPPSGDELSDSRSGAGVSQQLSQPIVNDDPPIDPEGFEALSVSEPSTIGAPAAISPTLPSPAPIRPQPDNPIEIVFGTAGTLINIAAKAIGMLFSPFFTAGYNGPGGFPLIWATLDLVRRELERAFFNTSPNAVADITTTSELVPTTIAVLANDTDWQGDPLTVVGYTEAHNGTVVLNSDGSFTYTPDAGFTGVDTFSYTISDEAGPWHLHGLRGLLLRGGHASTAVVTITVESAPSNVAPVADDDAATLTQGSGPTFIDVLDNDSDSDGDALSVTGVTQPSDGTVTFTTTGVSYTPNTGFSGTEIFTYTLSDGSTTAVGTVTVTVTPVVVVNTAPTAVHDEAITAEDTAVDIHVTANDIDAENDLLDVTAASGAQHGVLVIDGNTITYTPNANWHGVDSFTYIISDGEHEATATVAVTVTPVNDAPVADADTASLLQGSGATPINVLANDSDPDADSLSVTEVTQPENGTVTFTATGVSYTPDAAFAGTETFTYTLSDGTTTTIGTVTVTVTPVNQAPRVVISNVEVDDDGVVTGLITVTDPDGPGLTVTPPAVATGSVEITNLGDGAFTFTFTPTQEARETAWATPGDDTVTLTFTVSDGVAPPVTSSTAATIAPLEPTTDPGGEYGTIDLADLDSLSGIEVTADGEVYAIGGLDFDFDGDGETDHFGFALGTIDLPGQTFTPIVLLPDSDQPFDLEVGPNGWLYVADTTTGVTAYDPANGYAPTTITTEPATQVVFANDRLYVTTFTGGPMTPSAGFLSIYDTDFNQIGASVELDGISAGLAAGPAGQIYVTTFELPDGPTGQPSNGKLTIYDADGIPVTGVSLLGHIPYGLAVDVDGIAYIADPSIDTVLVVDPVSGILGKIDSSTGTSSMDIGPDGLLYVTNYYNASVDVLDPADMTPVDPGGEYGTVELTDLDLLTGISVTTAGQVYVIGSGSLDFDGDGEIDYDGFTLGTVDVDDQTFTPLVLLEDSDQPYDVEVGPNGWIYVADTVVGVTAYDPANGYAPTTVTNEPATQVLYANDKLYVTTYTLVSGVPTTGYLHIFDSDLNPIGSPITLGSVSAGLAVGPTGLLYITTLTIPTDPSELTIGGLAIYTADGTPVTNIPLAGSYPYGVAVDEQGIAYVVDLIAQAIIAVDPEAGIVGRIDGLSGVLGIEIGPDGLLYVTNQATRSVDVLDPADATSGPGYDTVSLSELSNLSGITVTTGGLVYVIGGDVGDFALGTVDVEDQTFTPVILLAGSGQPFDLAVGPNGWIYVADTSSGVTAYDPTNGDAPTTVTTEPATQVVYANDRLYVTTYTLDSGIPTGGYLHIFDANLTLIGSPITLSGVSAGLAVGPTGQLYITTLTYATDPSQPPTSALNIYTADGAPVTTIPLTGILAYGVTVDDQGIAYVVNATGGRIMAVDPEVGIIGKINSAPGTLGIDIGPDGLLYVTNQISRSVDVLEIEIHPNLAPTVGTPAFGITSTGGWGTQYGTVNVADTDGDPLTFTLVSGSIDSEVGDVLVDPLNGSWVFTPTLQARFAAAAASDPVNATFTLLVTDGIDFVTVLVSAPITPYHNQAPQVSGLGFTIESIDPDSGVVSGYLSVSDADTNYYPEFGQLSYSVDGTITDALVQIDAAGRFTYTPSESARVNAFISEDFDAAYFSVIVSDGESSVVVDVELPIVPLAVPTGDQGLAVAADGRMYFTSYLPHDGAGRVIVLNPDKTYVTTINLATVLNQPFASAYDVVVGADGRIFVSSEVGASAAAIASETGTGAIVVINPENDYLATVFAELDKPVSALAVGPDGRVYVANWNDDRIAVFNADGSSHSTITSAEIVEDDGTGVAGLALGSDGRLYLTKPGLGAIKVISSNGSTVDVFDVGGSPWAIALAADGSAYVTDFDSTSVSVIGSNGAALRTIRIPSGGSASDVTVAQDGTVLIAYSTSAGSQIMAVSPTVPGGEPDATQLGDAILGEPIQSGAPLPAGDVLYQTTVRSGPDGQTSTSVTVILPNGERFTFHAAGSPAEPAVLGPDSSAYQTVTVYDVSISAYQSGVLIVTNTGESRFTGLYTGTAVGSTVFGLDGTGYQVLSSQNSESGAFATTVLVITPTGVSAYAVEGYAGSPLAGEFGVVVAPDGAVYLTTTSLTEPEGSESGFITTVSRFGAAGRLSAFNTAGFAGGPVVIAPDGAVYQTIGDVSVESGTGRAQFTASVAVVTAAGLVVLPQTSQGAPVGAAAITAAGHIYQTTVDVAHIDAPADRLWHLLETIEPDSIAWAFERTPTAVEVVGNRIYIADSSGTLTILEDTGAFVTSIYLGDESGTAASAISDLAVDGNGRIYVANASVGMVWAFDPMSTDAAVDVFSIPGAMALALSTTGKLYAVGFDASGNATLNIADPAAPGTVLASNLGIDSPVIDLKVGTSGRIYVATSTSVVVLEHDGSPAAVTINSSGRTITALALDDDEQLYLTATGGSFGGAAHLAAYKADGSYAGSVPLSAQGPMAIGPDGRVFILNPASASIDVVTLSPTLPPEPASTTRITAIAQITAAGLAIVSDAIAGEPIDSDNVPAPLIAGADGTVYQTVSVTNSDTGDLQTTILRVGVSGPLLSVNVLGVPVGPVVAGIDGTAFQTTFDEATDTTRIVIMANGDYTTIEIVGYPGSLESEYSAKTSVIVADDGRAYQTLTTVDPETGGYTTTVVTIVDGNATVATLVGAAVGPVAIGPGGFAYQTVSTYDFDVQSYVTTVAIVDSDALVPVADGLVGQPTGPVAFDADGTIYVALRHDAADQSQTTVHILGQAGAMRSMPLSASRLSGASAAPGSATAMSLRTSLTTSSSSTAPGHWKINGEVFLRGKYIELGVSALGSFGTTSGRVGLVYDRDGFGTGNNTRIDFYTPDTPEERWSVGFGQPARALGLPQWKYGGFSALNGSYGPATTLTKKSLVDKSSGDKLSATFTATVQGALTVTQTHTFKVNDTYYATTVTLKNVSDKTLTNVEFMRSFDPDNTRSVGGSNSTVNTVGGQYGTERYSLVTAASIVGDAYNRASGERAVVFLYSTHPAAIAYTGGFTNSNPDDFDSPVQPRWHTTTSDDAIGIVFRFERLSVGQEVSFTYYTGVRSDNSPTGVISQITSNTTKNSVVSSAVPVTSRTVVSLADEMKRSLTSDRVKIDIVRSSTNQKRMIVYIGGITSFLDFSSLSEAVGAASNKNLIPAWVSGAIDAAMQYANPAQIVEIMLVGHSKGGIVAQAYALSGKYREKVSTVVTFGTQFYKARGDSLKVIHFLDPDDRVSLFGSSSGLELANKSGWVYNTPRRTGQDLINIPDPHSIENYRRAAQNMQWDTRTTNTQNRYWQTVKQEVLEYSGTVIDSWVSEA